MAKLQSRGVGWRQTETCPGQSCFQAAPPVGGTTTLTLSSEHLAICTALCYEQRMGLSYCMLSLRNPRLPDREPIEVEALAHTGATYLLAPRLQNHDIMNIRIPPRIVFCLSLLLLANIALAGTGYEITSTGKDGNTVTYDVCPLTGDRNFSRLALRSIRSAS